MTSFLEINNELVRLGEEIETLSHGLWELREAWLRAEAEYDKTYARAVLETKLKNPDYTQTDIKAEAGLRAFDARMAMITAESAYKKSQENIKGKRDRLEALREVSFNLRSEANIR